jgi:LysB family phage lysis regulatory protein
MFFNLPYWFGTKSKLLVFAAAVLMVGYIILSYASMKQDLALAEVELKVAAETNKVLVGRIERDMKIASDFESIRAKMETLEQTVRASSADMKYNIARLRTSNEDVRKYLLAPVPADLGRLYTRPETTDPATYRVQNVVQPDPVSSSGAGATDFKQ